MTKNITAIIITAITVIITTSGCATRPQTETTSIVQVQEVQAVAVEQVEIVDITINGQATTTPRVYVMAEGFRSDARRAAEAEGYDSSAITTTTAWRNGHGY